MPEKDSDLQKIEELVELMKANDLAEIEISHGEDKFLLKRNQQPQPIVTAMPYGGPGGGNVACVGAADSSLHAGISEEVDSNLIDITSPIVGTFYAQPSPDSDPFVDEGSPVEEQTVVCIIEAMKVMNEIKAETSGTIAEICVKNGQAVEFGQVLFKVKPE